MAFPVWAAAQGPGGAAAAGQASCHGETDTEPYETGPPHRRCGGWLLPGPGPLLHPRTSGSSWRGVGAAAIHRPCGAPGPLSSHLSQPVVLSQGEHRLRDRGALRGGAAPGKAAPSPGGFEVHLCGAQPPDGWPADPSPGALPVLHGGVPGGRGLKSTFSRRR